MVEPIYADVFLLLIETQGARELVYNISLCQVFFYGIFLVYDES